MIVRGAEPLREASLVLGEGPVWDPNEGCLVMVDLLDRAVLLLDADGTQRRRVDLPWFVGAALPARSGGWLLATQGGFATLAADGAVRPLLDVLEPDGPLRFNDAACDPAGRALAGTMRYDERAGDGVLYRLDPGPAASPLRTGLGLSNGLDWSPDGRTLYLVDSLAQAVLSFDYDPDDSALGAAREPIPIDPAAGMPDGLCVDADGALWVALFGGAAVHRYTPSGQLDLVVPLPVSRPTSCAFAGPGSSRLVVTTATYGLDARARAREPLAGSVFVVETGAAGRATSLWDERTAEPVSS
jgi:sugar lactone lactonase YvrE